MKTNKATTFLTIVSMLLLLAACSETISNVEDSLEARNELKSNNINLTSGGSCTYSGILTESEIEGLMEMREEEKLAHDVYLTFYEEYGYLIFNNIAESEENHTNAILQLIDGYELTDPATSETGVFTNPAFTELFNSLTEKGSGSLIEALKAGAFIEEHDIKDLLDLLAETENKDIYRVYINLLESSQNHFQAFVSVLAKQGETYVPEIISVEEYQDILGATTNQSNNFSGKRNSYTGNQNCDGTGHGF